MQRVKKMYESWIESVTFVSGYERFLFSIPRRLTKKELLKLREVCSCTHMHTLSVCIIR
jgi:hypothetical protein